MRQRLRQACYGICAGSFVAIPAARVGEHPPSDGELVVLAGVAFFAGAMGMLIEVLEARSDHGGNDET
jgi:drug/metabolite transporter (DMT)-like permease